MPRISQVGRRLAWRLWPGPLTLVFPPAATDGLFGRLPLRVRQVIAPAGGLALCSSAEPFLRDVLELTPAPIVLGSLATADRAPAITADSLRGLAGLDMVIDSGPTQCGQPSTQVRIDEQRWTYRTRRRYRFQDAHPDVGADHSICLHRQHLPQSHGRSHLQADAGTAAGLSGREIEQRGYVVRSAGVAASSGSPAASHAVDVLRAMGGSLENHRSRRVTPDLVRQADCIFAMTADHLDALLDAVPEVQAHSYLLDPRGGDVPDPIGSDHHTYRQTAQTIEQMLEERLQQLGL